ncbi:MAG: hypothetical protein AAF488_12670 [Planctomycetota bacterium]
MAKSAELKSLFATVDTAARTRNGPAVVEHVDRATRAYFDRIRQHALDTPETDLRSLPLVEKAHVLLARSIFPVGQLEAMDGAELLSKLVAAGLIQFGFQLGDFRLAVEEAHAAVVHPSVAMPPSVEVRFHFEDDRWCLGHDGWIEATALLYAKEIEGSDETGDTALLLLLESKLNRPLPETVWTPPIRA